MQNSDNTLNLKQALLELLKVVKKNHYTKDENDSKLSLKVDDIIYQVDKNNLESEIKNLELSDEQIIGIINNEIKALIPNQASSTNQLADKDFVNSSISTATATFRGTYTSKSDFPLINVDINDYLWYDTTDSLGNRKFDKYKYSNGEWVYEYTLNNSSFTEEQWKAINSSATIESINKISINEENINNLNNTKLDKTEFNDFKNQNTLDLNNKVDKEEGKRLSTNDFTNELKEKLNGIEANAQVNTITGVKGDNEENYRVGNVSISKENIGLGNVDNTSDKDKPISDATQEALDLKADKSDVSEVDIDLEGTGSIVSIPENATGYGTIEKLGGKSYKSENLLVLEDKAETTINGLTYKVMNGIVYFNTDSNGTTNSCYIYLNLAEKIYIKDTKYSSMSGVSFNLNTQWYLTNNNSASFSEYRNKEPFIANSIGRNSLNLIYDNLSNNSYTQVYIYVSEGLVFNNVQFTPMLVSGTTAPTEFSQGFEGIKIEYPTNVKVVGRNLFDGLIEEGSIDASTGENRSESDRYRSKNYVAIKPNTTYTIGVNGIANSVNLFFYSNDKTYLGSNYKVYNSTFTSTTNAYYVRFYSTNELLNRTMLNEGLTALPYTPYTEHNLPQTNIINYVSTQLQTNHSWTQDNASKWLGLGVGNDSNIINYANKKAIVKYTIVDLGKLKWELFTDSSWHSWFSTDVKSLIKKLPNQETIPNMVSSNYEAKTNNDVIFSGLVGITSYYDNGNLFVYNGSTTERPTGLLIYELATPIEIDLSSLETEEHFECESNGSIIHDNLANYKYSFPVSLKGQVELNFEHDKEQQRDIDGLKKEIDSLKERIALLESK